MLHGVPKRQVVKLRAIAQFVVHRHQLGGMLVGLVLDCVTVDAWGGCHIQPTFGMQVVVVVDSHEVRLILTSQVTPVVRWASSHITRSNSSRPRAWASATVGSDW